MLDERVIVRDAKREVRVRDSGQVRILEIGRQGPPGGVGPQGPAGAEFTQVFASPLSSWIVNHNLGKEPLVSVLTTGGLEMVADVQHMSVNQLIVNFAAPTVGRIRCL